MRGRVLGVDARTGDGVVAGDDGARYTFGPTDWAAAGEPAIGLEVDFEAEARRALNLFPAPVPAVWTGEPASVPATAAATPATSASERNRFVAALLAFCLGPLGIHRFYLGRTASGVAMLVLSVTVIGLGLSVPWALIDTVRYLLMSDREFAARYSRRD